MIARVSRTRLAFVIGTDVYEHFVNTKVSRSAISKYFREMGSNFRVTREESMHVPSNQIFNDYFSF